MDLYLIRHAEAVPVGEGSITTDAERPLTEAGIKQARRLAGAMQRHGVALDIVLTSPLTRARQTAEEILRNWAVPVPALQVVDHLAPGGKRKQLCRTLVKLGKNSVALVGHQPDLGDLASWLIGDKKGQIDLEKAGVALINSSNAPCRGSGVLVWLVTPAWY